MRTIRHERHSVNA